MTGITLFLGYTENSNNMLSLVRIFHFLQQNISIFQNLFILLKTPKPASMEKALAWILWYISTRINKTRKPRNSMEIRFSNII